MSSIKPTFLKRDAFLASWIAGLPVFTGSWKQRSDAAATHLPSVQVFMGYTATAGFASSHICKGAAEFQQHLFLWPCAPLKVTPERLDTIRHITINYERFFNYLGMLPTKYDFSLATNATI